MTGTSIFIATGPPLSEDEAFAVTLTERAACSGRSRLAEARFLLADDEKRTHRVAPPDFALRSRLWLKAEIHRLELEDAIG